MEEPKTAPSEDNPERAVVADPGANGNVRMSTFVVSVVKEILWVGTKEECRMGGVMAALVAEVDAKVMDACVPPRPNEGISGVCRIVVLKVVLEYVSWPVTSETTRGVTSPRLEDTVDVEFTRIVAFAVDVLFQL